MLGSLLSRALIMVFGYVYPSYRCYKAVEKNKPDFEKLRFWCQYWILVALFTVVERFGDVLISWLPFYHEAKLAFFVYLWHPKTMGTVIIYDGFLQPYVAMHESDIDQNIMELRVRATDAIVMFWRQSATYSQARIFDILQYFVSQSYSLRSRPPKGRQEEQEQPQQLNQTPPLVPARDPRQQHEQHEEHPIPDPAAIPRNYQQQQEEEHRQPRRVLSRSHDVLVQPPLDDDPHASIPTSKPRLGAPNADNVDNSEASDLEALLVESSDILENDDPSSNKVVMMEDAVRVTRARFRKNIFSRASADP